MERVLLSVDESNDTKVSSKNLEESQSQCRLLTLGLSVVQNLNCWTVYELHIECLEVLDLNVWVLALNQ